MTPDHASSAIDVGAFNEVAQRSFHHAEVRPPRHHGDIAVPLDMEFQQTAFEQGDLISLAGNDARTHLNARRLIAVIVPMELQAPFATYERPILALRRPLVEKMQRSAKILQAAGAAGDKECFGLDAVAQIKEVPRPFRWGAFWLCRAGFGLDMLSRLRCSQCQHRSRRCCEQH